MVLLLFALPTSDKVVARTPLHLMYDFLYELLSSRVSYFSFRYLISTTRSSQCRTTIVDAVMKFMMELVTLLRRITSVFGDEDFSRQVICASERSIPFSAARVSEGFVDIIICHSASLLWLKFLRGPVCTRPVLLVFNVTGLMKPHFSITVVWASAPQVIGSFPPSKEFATPVYNQVHQQQIGAEETTQTIVEISIVQVIVLEIPEVQIAGEDPGTNCGDH